MMTTAADLRAYVGATADDDAYLTKCVSEATTMVAEHIGDATVPEDIEDRAVLEVGSELYHRRQAPHGVAQFGAFDGAPVRVSRDPMNVARPILAPYVVGGFA